MRIIDAVRAFLVAQSTPENLMVVAEVMRGSVRVERTTPRLTSSCFVIFIPRFRRHDSSLVRDHVKNGQAAA
jgi:hypothetical protein